MTRGPKRKPTALHVVAGTFKPSRHGEIAANEPRPTGALQKPAYLKGKPGKVWDRIAIKLDWLTAADSDTLALWCGLQIEAETCLAEMTAARISQLRTLSAELGLTPAGRARIGAASRKERTRTTSFSTDRVELAVTQ